MDTRKFDTVVVGGGQAGIAMSEHLSNNGISHIVLERYRVAERWRTSRWNSLVANGPAWHDRFPGMEFKAHAAEEFPSKEAVAEYLEDYARMVDAPIECGIEVKRVRKRKGTGGFEVSTSGGTFHANHVVAATGPFQRPAIPGLIPKDSDLMQIHSTDYRSPTQLPEGAVIVIGGGSSGSQIAEELMLSGRRTFLSVGAHDRPPRSYRGRDFVWWLGVLGKWSIQSSEAGREHVTIAVSGANGGRTVDYRRFAASGMTIVGVTQSYRDGTLHFADDLRANIERGDSNYLSLLDEADAFVESNGLDLPGEPGARDLLPDPDCLVEPLRELNLAQEGVSAVIWATGFTTDYGWLEVDALDAKGRPNHQRGISSEPGVYFLGLPWQTCRGSSFIWGVWHDAKFIADQIAVRGSYFAHQSLTGCQDSRSK